MANCDLTLATGGQPMVRAAYSSGRPAYGVGAGNSTMVIDETADIDIAARNTRMSKTSDFGSGCSADGNMLIDSRIYDALVAALVKEGGYLASKSQADAIEKVMWDEHGHRLPQTVACPPQAIAQGCRLRDPARSQVHRRRERQDRYAAQLLAREADDAARRLSL